MAFCEELVGIRIIQVTDWDKLKLALLHFYKQNQSSLKKELFIGHLNTMNKFVLNRVREIRDAMEEHKLFCINTAYEFGYLPESVINDLYCILQKCTICEQIMQPSGKIEEDEITEKLRLALEWRKNLSPTEQEYIEVIIGNCYPCAACGAGET